MVSAAACVVGGHDPRANQKNTGLWSSGGAEVCLHLRGLVFRLKQKNKTNKKNTFIAGSMKLTAACLWKRRLTTSYNPILAG